MRISGRIIIRIALLFARMLWNKYNSIFYEEIFFIIHDMYSAFKLRYLHTAPRFIKLGSILYCAYEEFLICDRFLVYYEFKRETVENNFCANLRGKQRSFFSIFVWGTGAILVFRNCILSMHKQLGVRYNRI